jgi:glycosyltransferase involved in cell wall biosynthesis
MPAPLVSVIVPVYNGADFLAEALESILTQDYEPVEVIVVDDGSQDASGDLARSHPVRYLRQRHRGIAAARNAGVEAARGELVSFNDADDLWIAGKLRAQVEYLGSHTEIDLVLGRMEVFVQPHTELPAWVPQAWLSAPQNGLLQTMLARREVFERVGQFDTSFSTGEDTDWLARAFDARLGVAPLPDVVLRYRLHGANTTHRHHQSVTPALMRVLRASARRKRERRDSVGAEPDAG